MVVAHDALLFANPAITAAYQSDPDALDHFGLPMTGPVDEGDVIVVRTQRAVFQQWKQAMPWAAAGQVTIADGGDIAKEEGLPPGFQTSGSQGMAGPAPGERGRPSLLARKHSSSRKHTAWSTATRPSLRSRLVRQPQPGRSSSSEQPMSFVRPLALPGIMASWCGSSAAAAASSPPPCCPSATPPRG